MDPSKKQRLDLGWAVLSHLQADPNTEPTPCSREPQHMCHEREDLADHWCAGSGCVHVFKGKTYRHDALNILDGPDKIDLDKVFVYVPETADFQGFGSEALVADSLANMSTFAPSDEEVAAKALLVEGQQARQLTRDGHRDAPARKHRALSSRTFVITRRSIRKPPQVEMKVPYIPDLIPTAANRAKG